VILLRAFLVPQTPRGRRWTEVRAAIASARSGRPSGTARCETTATATARARTTEPTATAEAATTAGTWTAKSSARTRAEASGSWWTRRAILTSASFAHCERPALERLRVELADDFLRLFTVCKLDERKSARTAGLAIDRHGNVGRLCDGREVGPEIGLARTVREVPDEQTDCQGLLVKSAPARSGVRFYLKYKSQRQKGKVKVKVAETTTQRPWRQLTGWNP
jgi:hypothetical protein